MSNESRSRRDFIKKTSLIGAAIPLAGLSNAIAVEHSSAENIVTPMSSPGGVYDISITDKKINITAGILARQIDISNNNFIIQRLRVNGTEILSGPANDFQFSIYKATPNTRPAGLKLTNEGKLIWADNSAVTDKADNQPVQWNEVCQINGKILSDRFKIVDTNINQPKPGVTRLNITALSLSANDLNGLAINVYYEIYDGYPAICKWISVSNNSALWLKIDKLFIDDINLASEYANAIPLTPEEQGAESSIISFSNKQNTLGIIAASEIPSATRKIKKNGAMGYTDEFFEWVIGPSESFISEPVFHFAYSGDVLKTISGISTPLDRATERPFKNFLKNCVGLRGSSTALPAPIWCSYTNFLVDLTDQNMRQQADIAQRIGFITFQLDEGWAKTPSPGGSEADPARFPDFDATCKYIISKGLKLGLWISCFRGTDAKDLVAMPDGRNLPLFTNTKRGYGMSFASNWRNYFANDLAYMYGRYGMSYVKMDLTNISKGDIADGHDSRTKKESLLRGLRGLLEVNKQLAETTPELWTQVTHEIYWRTPGPPADIAVLKYACAFHTTPNTYLGAGNGSKRVSQDWPYDPLKLRADLIKSCEQARHRFFDHRGLPAYGIEFYAAHAVNVKGSLTPAVQDRQICSWLMGGPTVFAGDLSSLTDEHILHYRKRFDLLKMLQSKYDIYGHFQFSGVPVPTDTDWHWWGKLNDKGYGVVVVIRGNGGEAARFINVPWANRNKKYVVTAHFANKKLGVYSGEALINGAIKLNLPVLGQEILELSQTS